MSADATSSRASRRSSDRSNTLNTLAGALRPGLFFGRLRWRGRAWADDRGPLPNFLAEGDIPAAEGGTSPPGFARSVGHWFARLREAGPGPKPSPLMHRPEAAALPELHARREGSRRPPPAAAGLCRPGRAPCPGGTVSIPRSCTLNRVGQHRSAASVPAPVGLRWLHALVRGQRGGAARRPAAGAKKGGWNKVPATGGKIGTRLRSGRGSLHRRCGRARRRSRCRSRSRSCRAAGSG